MNAENENIKPGDLLEIKEGIIYFNYFENNTICTSSNKIYKGKQDVVFMNLAFGKWKTKKKRFRHNDDYGYEFFGYIFLPPDGFQPIFVYEEYLRYFKKVDL